MQAWDAEIKRRLIETTETARDVLNIVHSTTLTTSDAMDIINQLVISRRTVVDLISQAENAEVGAMRVQTLRILLNTWTHLIQIVSNYRSNVIQRNRAAIGLLDEKQDGLIKNKNRP